MAGEVTQLTPQGVGGYFEIPDKSSVGFVDKTASDSVRLFITESPVAQETEVYDYIRLFLAEARNVIVIPPIPQDNIRLVLSDIAQLPVIVGAPQPKAASDTVRLVISSTPPDVTVSSTASDSIVLVISGNLTGPPVVVGPVEKSGTESIVLVLADSAEVAVDVTASDSVVLVLDDVADSPVEEPTLDEIPGEDGIILVIAEGAGTVAEPFSSSDSIVLFLTETNSGGIVDVEPVVANVSDTITLVLSDLFDTIEPIDPEVEFERVDTVTLRISESQAIQRYGDVDYIAISSRPYGYIKITPV
jgi:hypothetical protein